MNDKEVSINAYKTFMGRTDEGDLIHMFYLFVNGKKIMDNSSHSSERHNQLRNFYETHAMVVELALEAVGYEVSTTLEL
jgi:hypothetical protein